MEPFHRLKPADIKVIGALGDSLTAGNGAGSKPGDILDVLTQYRGLSWSGGGDHNLSSVTTLPNILREFNPSLRGFSVGTGKENSPGAFLNQAVAGDRAEDLPVQARRLVDLMKNDTKINFQEDWKIITLFIGGNDLCDFCSDPVRYSPQNFTDNIGKALDILHAEVPRAFVNLVKVLEIINLRELYQEKEVSCPRLILRNLCPCVLKPDDNSTELASLIEVNKQYQVPRALVNLVDFLSPSVLRQVFLGNPDRCPVQQASVLCNCVLTPRESSQELARLEAITQAYQSSMRELVGSGRYDTREDFSVVLQPFFHKVRLPLLADGRLDMSFFAPDCLHPSQKFHSQLSRALWVNMLEPLGRKTETLDLAANIALFCPTQNEPFLRTPRNSNYTYPTKPDIENWGSDFLCTEWNPSNGVPTSVHELRPGDIKVVAAMGDSLTTALGAQPSNSSNLPTSWRGLSWSIGGDGILDTHTTLPNILKKFNPHILGFSTGTQEETAGLNVAVEGARAWDMPTQARDLVERMKNHPEINLESDWKLITLFIGSNDICHYCENPEAPSAGEYIQHIQQALDIFYEELPRAFINVVGVMELAGLHQGQGGKCDPPLAAQSNCTCLRRSQENPLELQELKQVNWNFQSGISRLSYKPQYLQREDFAVVVQPFFQNTLVPLNSRGSVDLTFFSEDCFHFSERGHAEMAIALWNNMVSA
ncbi:phospholipase B1, membrane-associated [Leptonychotes weddellii]|uniref:Phospholipase B1, membrane-associated n=1 Tax=Leptonychotes weddellii TaxID=9713 RepID=A0A7F8RJV8_LEPWE|nr:phospholipase B1, membrane-associated [Leptonychotes weddellii]